MLRFPEVQKKAQAEIDAVIGTNRLPRVSDRPSLPYIRSVVTEVYRWLPAVPLGMTLCCPSRGRTRTDNNTRYPTFPQTG